MRGFGVIVLALGLTFGASNSYAQSADISGPAEIPSASYKANQYVDSKGCVFIRAGYGGVVNWVPRVSRDRKVLCGYTPSQGAATQTIAPAAGADETAANEGAVTVIGATVPTATKPVRKKKVRVMAPTGPRGLRQVTATAASSRELTCPAELPRVQRYRLSDGRHLLRCAPAADQPANYRILAEPKPLATGAGKVPAGYKPAWNDGRLNPNRGERNAQGQAAMAKIWSDGVPAEMVAAPAAIVAEPIFSDAGVPVAASGHRYVQIGTFAVAANALRTQQDVAELGLPVASNNTVMNGKSVQVILAGPFGSAADAAQALSTIRSAGFGDAFLRG